ncbi:MAG: pyridoxal-phosphate dependent enzyme [Planctomycetaceae bacterium]|nr:pyridoxal-phosphate dependent enzyme [Planctomycetaceae bacterium]
MLSSQSDQSSQRAAFQQCIAPDCGQTYGLDEVLPLCPACGELLDVTYDWDRVPVPASLREFEARWSSRRNPVDFSGVWRFRELLPFAREDQIVTIGEGQTILQLSDSCATWAGLKPGGLRLQYEGLNPSGSFKDNGMTAAATHARMTGATTAACASTGNTSASLAIYASTTQLFRVVVFVGSGKIAFGKLSQALDYGALTLQLDGDFDDALIRVREVCQAEGIYLCNSLNPFRLEGQKAIIYRILESLNWEPPDWIAVPGGNLGNSSAFGKALIELRHLGLIDRVPRVAVINASGASTLDDLYNGRDLRWNGGRPDKALIDGWYSEQDAEKKRAKTMASAIEIGRPVNLVKCLRTLEATDGLVCSVTDQQILDAKAQIGAAGFGCEPASAASLAGVKLLREQGQIAPSDRVVCVLTGHQLKDPDATVTYHSSDPAGEVTSQRFLDHEVTSAPAANRPIPVANDSAAIISRIRELLHA